MTYTETNLQARFDALLDAAGLTGALDADQLNRFDQYHTGGTDAVDALIPGLQVGPGDTVLDVGSGFGGPARRIAQHTGAGVVGIDITAAYVDVATALTTRCGLADRVTFHHTGITDLRVDKPFDAALTMHVTMNVQDQASWYAAIAATVKPGGRLAIWEICATDPAWIPDWPMPWSIDGTDSHLTTPDRLRDALLGCRLEVVDWVDEAPWAVQWFAALRATPAAGVSPTPPPLAVLDNQQTRAQNLAAALIGGHATVIRGTFTTPG